MEKFLWIAGALSAFLLCNSHSAQQIEHEQAELSDPCIRSFIVADPTEAENGMKNDLSVERKERYSICMKGSLHVPKSPVGRRFRTLINAFAPSSCDNVGSRQLDIENESCNERSGPLGYRADPDNCQKFYQCAHGKWVSKDCPAGLAWNSDTATCDWPRNVPECNFA
ncbi:putative chitinase 3 [Toxocara canis]|uniref:Putative chitinase 3 n=1 Tax=Toxocara canis TaxID=6265 RepID=A0A0B2VJA8_TOXCA|nr:putative chitinase 3 [Toxocara canis]